MIIWFVCIGILAALVVVGCSLAIASDADDIADKTLDRINDCKND